MNTNYEYNGMSAEAKTAMQQAKCNEILDVLVAAGHTDFRVSPSVTNFGCSCYIQGMYGLKFRISDHDANSTARIFNEVFISLSTTAEWVLKMVEERKAAIAAQVEAKRSAADRIEMMWEAIKGDFAGLLFKSNDRTYQDLETFASKGKAPRTNVFQTVLTSGYGNAAYSYEWTEPADLAGATGKARPSAAFIENYYNSKN